MAKQKQHDSIDDMARFSEEWHKYPILYNTHARDKLFKENWKTAGKELNHCYEQLAVALNLTVAEVKTRRLKYKDAITRAMRHFAADLENGTTNCPTPSATKMLIFFWLLPFSSHYNADLMGDKCLDVYVEKMIQAHMNKLSRDKQDVTELRQTLHQVRKIVRDSGKPKHLELHVKKLCFTDLQSVSSEYGVTFLAKMTVCNDDSAQLVEIPPHEVVDIAALPYKISSWLSRMREPEFDWKVHGFEHYSCSVTNVQPSLSTATVGRSCRSVIAFNKYVSARQRAW